MRIKILSLAAVAVAITAACSCGANSNGEQNKVTDSVVSKANKAYESKIGNKKGEGSDNELNGKYLKLRDNTLFPEGRPAVVDFYADWCGPCKTYSPIFHEVADEFAGQATFISINVDEYPGIANTYKVSAIPTTLFILPGGGVMGSQEGLIDKGTLTAFVTQLLETNAGDGMGL